jgi:ribosomal protein L7/L12
MGWFSDSPDPALMLRLARIERKLDALMAALDVQVPSDGMDDIRALADAGRKIEAIKLLRDRTGMGLAEAKQAVDQGV